MSEHKTRIGFVGVGSMGQCAHLKNYVTLEDCEVKVLKPQNIVENLHAGSRDVGFAGADWVAELGLDGALARLGELVECEVAAIPPCTGAERLAAVVAGAIGPDE